MRDTSAMPKFPLAGIAALLLAACSTTPRVPSAATTSIALQAADAVVVTETYVSEKVDGELDSLAAWTADDGATWLVASAKSSHRLVVFDADSGQRVRTVGGKGAAPGEFMRPNGVAVFGDLLFVVERDNRRVQVLRLPEFVPVGSFGNGELRSPYGLWLTETAPGELQVYITDSFMDGPRFDVVPPLAQLGERVRRYRVQLHADDGSEAPAFDVPAFNTHYLGAFGDISEAAALRMVESIAGDPAHARLLIADEHRRHSSNLREYGFDGRFTGRSLPEDTFDGEAEGVALWSCRNDRGYWVAVDQQAPLTTFHLFDRDDLSPRGSFKGTVTAQTDGIALHAAASARFPAGALFAVHDDRAVAAFDLRDIVQALRLDPDCLQ
jgi:3-phytase